MIDPKQLERGKTAVQELPKYTPPVVAYIGSHAKSLYKLEEKRSEIMQACANEYAKLAGIPKSEFWTKTMPQVMFDTLESYQAEVSITAAEAYLKMLGWKVERPA